MLPSATSKSFWIFIRCSLPFFLLHTFLFSSFIPSFFLSFISFSLLPFFFLSFFFIVKAVKLKAEVYGGSCSFSFKIDLLYGYVSFKTYWSLLIIFSTLMSDYFICNIFFFLSKLNCLHLTYGCWGLSAVFIPSLSISGLLCARHCTKK